LLKVYPLPAEGTFCLPRIQPAAQKSQCLLTFGIVCIDATIVTSCLETDQAKPTWKKTFGFHPLTVFADQAQQEKWGALWPSCCGPAGGCHFYSS
jgi:hypothetical protein